MLSRKIIIGKNKYTTPVSNDLLYICGLFTDGFAVIDKATKQLVSGYPTFDNAVLKLL